MFAACLVQRGCRSIDVPYQSSLVIATVTSGTRGAMIGISVKRAKERQSDLALYMPRVFSFVGKRNGSSDLIDRHLVRLRFSRYIMKSCSGLVQRTGRGLVRSKRCEAIWCDFSTWKHILFTEPMLINHQPASWHMTYGLLILDESRQV